jgi:hypothetical protein
VTDPAFGGGLGLPFGLSKVLRIGDRQATADVGAEAGMQGRRLGAFVEMTSTDLL